MDIVNSVLVVDKLGMKLDMLLAIIQLVSEECFVEESMGYLLVLVDWLFTRLEEEESKRKSNAKDLKFC